MCTVLKASNAVEQPDTDHAVVFLPKHPSMNPAAGMPMTAEEYIKNRVEQHQKWYDGKSVKCKNRYLQTKAFLVVGGVLVPILINVSSQYKHSGTPAVQLIVTIISLLVVICVSLESVFH